MTEPPVWMGPPGDEEPQAPDEPGGVVVAVLAVAGALSFTPLAALALLACYVSGISGGRTTLAIVTAGVAFGGGGALCLIRSRLWRGFGIGLMIGWALLSIVTGGCTGLTPYPYQ